MYIYICVGQNVRLSYICFVVVILTFLVYSIDVFIINTSIVEFLWGQPHKKVQIMYPRYEFENY